MRIQERVTSESLSFLAEVEEGLATISTADRDEMMEELRSHISQLVSEGEYESLREALGEPKLYALELIKASGFEMTPQQSKFQKLAKLPTVSKILLITISVALVGWLLAALVIIAQNYQVSSNRNQYEINQLVPDDFYVVPDFRGLPANYVVEFLTTANVPLCSATNLREGPLESLEVVSQLPMPGEVINSVIQCVELTVTSR